MSQRVARTDGALYSEPKTKQIRRRRCDGHLTDAHWIEPGEQFVWSALPPYNPEIGNERWWHAAFCMDCAPLATATQETP